MSPVMDSRSLFYCLLPLLPLLYLTKYYVASKRPRRRALRLPPGPWRLPIIGSLHHLLGAAPHRALRDLSRHYGPLVFLKFGEVPVVVASSREAAMEVMRTHDAIFATRPQTATIRTLTKQGQAIAFTPYGDHWRQLRKICVLELLSAKRVQSFRPVREEEAAQLVQAVSSTSTPLVNLSALLDAYVVDTTVHSIMGNRLKERDAFLRYINEAIRLAGGFSLADLFPSSWLAGALSWQAHRVEAYQERLFAFLDCVIREHIERRSQEEAALQEDLIDVLLRIRSQGSNKSPLTMGTIKAVVFDLFAAGSETVATTLQWAMTELMRNPTVMSRAQAEVRRSFMGEMKVTEDGLSKLSYFHWVIKETLRLHTPGPLLLPKECQETCQLMAEPSSAVPRGQNGQKSAWLHAFCD